MPRKREDVFLKLQEDMPDDRRQFLVHLGRVFVASIFPTWLAKGGPRRPPADDPRDLELLPVSSKFHVAPAGNDCRWTASHSDGTLVVGFDDWPGEFFTLWFPEYIGAFGLPNRAAGDWKKGQTWNVDPAANQAWQCRTWDTYCTFRSEIRPFRQGLRLTLIVTNLTSETLRDGWANICLRCCYAPSFNDPKLARTFVRAKGRWTPLGTIATQDDTKHGLLLPEVCGLCKRSAGHALRAQQSLLAF
jgi:hypothetical protein